MAERVILFSAPMIQAVQAGRKTQTRRLAKPRHRVSLLATEEDAEGVVTPMWTDSYILDPGNRDWLLRDAAMLPGDTVWVKENYHLDVAYDGTKPSEPPKEAAVWYAAGGQVGDGVRGKLRPSIHMPRFASRLTIECTDVRVERLHDCSADDAIEEGLEVINCTGLGDEPGVPSWPEPDHYRGYAGAEWEESPVEAYKALWLHINGSGSWDLNPLVWVYTFRRVDP